MPPTVALPTCTTAQYGWAGSRVSVNVVVAADDVFCDVSHALQPVGRAAMGVGGVPMVAMFWLLQTALEPQVDALDVPKTLETPFKAGALESQYSAHSAPVSAA